MFFRRSWWPHVVVVRRRRRRRRLAQLGGVSRRAQITDVIVSRGGTLFFAHAAQLPLRGRRLVHTAIAACFCWCARRSPISMSPPRACSSTRPRAQRRRCTSFVEMPHTAPGSRREGTGSSDRTETTSTERRGGARATKEMNEWSTSTTRRCRPGAGAALFSSSVSSLAGGARLHPLPERLCPSVSRLAGLCVAAARRRLVVTEPMPRPARFVIAAGVVGLIAIVVAIRGALDGAESRGRGSFVIACS